jgi:hypothetical protein
MFTLPEDLSKLSVDELQALHEEGLAEGRRISELPDDELTDETLAEAEAVIEALATVTTEVDTRAAAEAVRTDRIAALRGKVADAEDGRPGGPEGDPEEEPAEEEEPEAGRPGGPEGDPEEEEAPAEGKKVPVAASAARTAVSKVARKAPAVIIHEEEPAVATPGFVASANVPGYSAGADLKDFDGVALAFSARARGFNAPSGRPSKTKPLSAGAKSAFALSDSAARFGVARIDKPVNELSTGMDQPIAEQMRIVNEAANEKRLPKGGLVAAGGWCAPSETLYDFCSLETVSGILSIPEISVSRGGINYTKGPDYAAIAAAWGFIQTEAQAEAGTEKVCYEVECPPFTEIRLDAIGFCITAGILTEVGYPELVRRVLEIGAVAHAHKVNKYVIDHISTIIGAAVDFAEVGSATADVLDAFSLAATATRYKYSLAPDATLEGVLPVWAKEIFRSDLSRRTGVDMLAVTDAQITSYLGVRNIAVQWVYDYLVPAPAPAWTSWPDTLEFMLYPAGAFVKGTTPVIDLDTIYDSVGLSTNTYTAAFFEEGIFVANTCAGGVKYTIDIACLAGVTGAADITCAAP